MKNFLFLIPYLFLLSGLNHTCSAQLSKKCDYLVSLFNVEKIANDLKLKDGKLKVIRLIDIDGYFKKCWCEQKLLHIRTIHKIPLDINIGRFIDFAIQDVKKKNNSITIVFLYVLGQTMWSGEITFERKSGRLITKDFKHYIVD